MVCCCLNMYCLAFLVIIAYIVRTSASQGPEILESRNWHLPRIDPIKLGYTRDYKVFQSVPGKVSSPMADTKMKTISMKPPVFEIPDFMTAEECDHFIMYSKRVGLKQSPQIVDSAEFNEETSEETFKSWDYDNNGLISPREIAWLPGKADIYLTDADIIKMFEELKIDTNGDGAIDFNEFKKVTVSAIAGYFDELRNIPHMRSRNSEQAWMFHDNPKYPLLADFHGRLHRLTKLPKHVIRHSEPVQVVRYGAHGHYHSHHDSDAVNSTQRCCTLYRSEDCRICRYITILIFLNEPLEGGETAFPFANNKTYDEESLKSEGYKLNLARHCHDANLYVKPQKGKAIMWYNHHRDPTSGWLGKLDQRTYHGGCDVIRGTKWIANIWLDVIGPSGSEDSFKGWLHADQDLGKSQTDKAEKKKNDDKNPKEEL